MQVMELTNILEGVDGKEYASRLIRSLKKDDLVWSFFTKTDRDQSKRIDSLATNNKLNPGTLGLLAFNDGLVENFPEHKLQVSYLEDCMLSYETYLQKHEPTDSFEEACKLAVVLLEKRRIIPAWHDIFLEIVSRMHIEDGKTFQSLWGTCLVIAINLSSEKEGLLSDLLTFTNPSVGIDSFIHCLISLPVDEDEKSQILNNSTKDQSVEIIEKILLFLNSVNEKVLAKSLANKNIDKYRSHEPIENNGLLANPLETLSQSIQCKQVATIAQLAGEYELSKRMLDQSARYLNAVTYGINVQKLSLLKNSGDESEISIVSNEEFDLVEEPAIALELASLGLISPLKDVSEGKRHPIALIQQAKKVFTAGNVELARAAAAKIFDGQNPSNADLVKDYQPLFNPNWNAAEMVESLIEMGATLDAAFLADRILAKNPASIETNILAADVYYQAKRYPEAITSYEFISISPARTNEIDRKLADCYQRVGNLEASYNVRKSLVEVESPIVEDLINFADVSLLLGNLDEVFEVIKNILELDPNNISGLTLNAKAHAVTGNNEKAAEYYTKAIELGADDPDAWIGFSDLHTGDNNHQKAIETLRSALTAMPGNSQIKRKLAEILMNTGAASEALPLLNDLATHELDEGVAVLQAEAMKTLGLPEYKELIASLFFRFPQNREISLAHAAELIKEGKHLEAKKVMLNQLDKSTPGDTSALTYADAVLGMDVCHSGEPKTVSTLELKKAQTIIDSCLELDMDNSRAHLLKAELLTNKRMFSQAADVYSKLLEKQASLDKSIIERVKAGFALTSAFLGKFEVALAAIKEAVDTKPEWIGLRKILAQIYALAGEVSEAVVQAEEVLQVGPQLLENVFWFVDLLTSLGKTEEAEVKLSKTIQEYPDRLLLTIRLADLQMKSGKINDAGILLEEIKSKISPRLLENELLSAAIVFKSVDDSESAIECLNLRAKSFPTELSHIDAAGYAFMLGKDDLAFEFLSNIEVNEENFNTIQSLKTDILIKKGDLEQAFSLVRDSHPVKNENLPFSEAFVPESWQKLMNSKNPAIEQKARILLLQGKVEECKKSVDNWVTNEPDNDTARVFAIESSLAAGVAPSQDLFQIQTSGVEDGQCLDHLSALRMDALIDAGLIIEAQQLHEKSKSSDNFSIKIVGIRLLKIEGRLGEAEDKFDELLSKVDESFTDKIEIKLGQVRLMAKTAVTLHRWNEALLFSNEAVQKYNWHIVNKLLALSTLVRAEEFVQSGVLIQIEAHNPSISLQLINVEEEIQILGGNLAGKNEKEVERWLLRGSMVCSPTDDNIQAFAHITPTPEDAAALIAALHNNGQDSTAVQIARKYPNDNEVLFELARVQADTNVVSALQTLNTMITNDPLNPAALAYRAMLHESLGKIDLAINDLEQAISDWPNETKWRVKVAELWQKYGNIKNAVNQLIAAYELQPEDTEISLPLSKAEIMDNNPKYAVEVLQKVTLKNPNLYEAWEILADAHSKNGEMELAIVASRKASEINPFSIKPYLMSGKLYLENGNLDKALEQARNAVNQNKKDAEAILFLAKVLNQQGEKRQALAALEMTNQCENVTVQTMIDHVNLVKEINGNPYAKELINSLTNKYPENVELLKLLANAQVENGDTSDAEQTVKRALIVEPDEPELHLFMGKINAESGQLDQAIHHLSQGIAQKNDNTDGYLMLSKVYEQQREFTKALDALKQAMEVTPNDTRSYLAAANLYRDSKNYIEAEKVLQKAVQIDPTDVTIRRQLGALLALKLVHHSQEASSQS